MEAKDEMRLIGKKGNEIIVDGLKNGKPTEFIASFHAKYGSINPPQQQRIDPILEMMQLLEIPKSLLFGSLASIFSDRIIQSLGSVSQEALVSLAHRSKGYLDDPSIRTVFLAVMEQLDSPPEDLLLILAAEKEIYQRCTVDLKRKVWMVDNDLFTSEVLPLLGEYSTYKGSLREEILRDKTSLQFAYGLFKGAVKIHTERGLEHLRIPLLAPSGCNWRGGKAYDKAVELAILVGNHSALYQQLITIITIKYVKFRDHAMCDLRFELLIILLEMGIQMVEEDYCYTLCWCLSAALKDGQIDNNRYREIRASIQDLMAEHGNHSRKLGDVSMVLAGSIIQQLILTNVNQKLHDLVLNRQLPRDSSRLIYLTQLLSCGQQSDSMFQADKFLFPKPEEGIVKEFLPMMTYVRLRAMKYASKTLEGEVDEDLLAYIEKSQVGSDILLFHILYLALKEDLANVKVLLGMLPPSLWCLSYWMADTLLGVLVAINDKALTQYMWERVLQPMPITSHLCPVLRAGVHSLRDHFDDVDTLLASLVPKEHAS